MRRNSIFTVILCTAILCIPQYMAAQVVSAPAGEVWRDEGIASWYGPDFDGRPTASGEVFNSALFTAAHPTLPFGTFLKVTNKQNNRWVTVKVNDRGPFVASRIIDVSKAAAEHLDMIAAGTVPVIIETLPTSYASPPAAQTNTPPPPPPPPAAAPSAIAQAPAAVPPPPPPPAPPTPPPAPPPPPPAPVYEQAPVYAPPPPPPPASIYTPPPPPPVYSQAPVYPPPPVYTPPPAVILEPMVPPEYSYAPYTPMVSPFYTQPPQQVQSPYPAITAFPPQTAPLAAPLAAPPAAPPIFESLPPQMPPPLETAPPSNSTRIKLTPAIIPAPNKNYRLQVGSYKVPRNAVEAFGKLKEAGLNPAYEQNGEFYRVVLTRIRGTELQSVTDKLEKAGFREAIIREEN